MTSLRVLLAAFGLLLFLFLAPSPSVPQLVYIESASGGGSQVTLTAEWGADLDIGDKFPNDGSDPVGTFEFEGPTIAPVRVANRFDPSSVSGTISKVELIVEVLSTTSAGSESWYIGAYGGDGQDDPEADAALTAFANANVSGNSYLTTTDLRTTGLKTIDLGAGAVSDLAAAISGASGFAIAIQQVDESTGSARYSELSEYTDGTNPPKLRVTYTGGGGGGDAPVYAADGFEGAGGSWDPVVPAGNENDLLLVFAGQASDGGGTPPTSDASFTDITTDPGGATEPAFLATRKTYASSEPSSYSFGFGDDVMGISVRVIGQDVASPIDGTPAYNEGSGTTLTCPSINTTVNDTLVMYVGVARTASFVTTPASATLQEAQSQSSGVLVGVASKTQAVAGATGADTYTISSTRGWLCYTIAIAPAS